MNTIQALVLAPTICLLTSCAHTSSKTPGAATEIATSGALVPMPEHGASALGRIHPDFIEGILATKHLDHIKLGFADNGEAWKLSIYHEDADSVPSAVKATALKELPDHSKHLFENEWRPDKSRQFEVKTTDTQGRSSEISTDADGSLLYREYAVAVNTLPAALAERIHQALPEGTLISVDVREDAHGKMYEAELQVDRLVHKLHINAAGTILAHHIKVPAVFYFKLAPQNSSQPVQRADSVPDQAGRSHS